MLDFDSMTWSCMVCGEERPDRVIGVAYRPLRGMEERFSEGARVNVRHCTDRATCVGWAHADGVWAGPPERAE